MSWEHRFYERQNQLIDVYTHNRIDSYHHEKASLITKYHPATQSVLDLGAGGGQNACATAMAGYEVTAIELVPAFAEHIQRLAEHNNQSLKVINANFYEIDLSQQFDTITYWDGFGIGSDYDQIRLLKRCANWLKSDGIMLLDVYTPWYWAKQHGYKMTFGDVHRQYEFDAERCRMLDTWWHIETLQNKVTQSLRCYSPADLQLTLKDTNLVYDGLVATGGYKSAASKYEDHAPLHTAMSYTVKLNLQTSPHHNNA